MHILFVVHNELDCQNCCSFCQDIQLSESPILIKLMDGEVGIMVVGYKHHWELLESNTGQVSNSNSISFPYSIDSGSDLEHAVRG
jgi:hypothetical protein